MKNEQRTLTLKSVPESFNKVEKLKEQRYTDKEKLRRTGLDNKQLRHLDVLESNTATDLIGQIKLRN